MVTDNVIGKIGFVLSKYKNISLKTSSISYFSAKKITNQKVYITLIKFRFSKLIPMGIEPMTPVLQDQCTNR